MLRSSERSVRYHHRPILHLRRNAAAVVTQQSRPSREVELASADGRIEACIIEPGAAVRDLKVRMRDGRMQRVVLGLATIADYAEHSPHMGAICGRFANRIR